MVILKKIFSFLLFPLALVSLHGCSVFYGEEGVFRGKTKDYLRAGSIAPVKIPEDMQSANLSPLYVIPKIEAVDDFGDTINLQEYEVPQPAGANTEKGEVGVKLQRIGEDKWIFLSASTSQVWPRTQNFLTRYGIPVASANPALGVIETGNVEFKDDQEYVSRFKIFIQKGIHPETTEIHLIQTQFPKGETVPNITWGDESVSIEKERLLLDELAGVLAESVNNNSASLLGQNVGGDVKVAFMTVNNEPTMRLRLPLVRARATVAHSLQREGFKLWGESVEDGIYYAGFDDNYKEDRGWVSSLFHDDLPDKSKYPLTQVVQHLSDAPESQALFSQFKDAKFAEPLKKAKGYLVVMTTSGKTMDVVIRDVRGEYIAKEEAKNLLRLLRKNLI
ncbi:Outer membrane protein assembly factor BamC [Thalassocella blandensis]|nr:Outer membrane protein assembly factor BamC [Thalassocella blandensis]